MSLNPNQTEKLRLHLVQRFWVFVLQISERLPKSKRVCPAERAKDNRKRIKLPIAAEMMKRQPS